MSASLQQVHVDAALSQISVDFSNRMGYVAEQVAPLVPVQKQSDFYYVMGKQKLRRFDTTVSPGSDFQRIDLEWDKKGYFFENGHGLEFAIPDQLRANADPGAQLDVQATKTLTENILIDQEYLLAQGPLASGNLTANGITNTTLSGTNQWSDYFNSDPITVIDLAKTTVLNQVAVVPNAAVVNDKLFFTLRNHPRIIDRVKYTGSGVRSPLSQDELRQALGLDYLFVATARYQTAHEGQADALGPIWGNHFYLFYRPANPGLMEPAFMYTLLWVGQGFGQLMSRYREQWRVQDVLQLQKYYLQQIISPGSAYVFISATS